MAGEMSLEVLFEDLQKVNRALRAGSLRQGDLQITRVQWMILRTLRKRPGCPIGQLAEKLDVRPSTMSQMLDRLEKMGWIVRRVGREDSRVRTVDLTPEGQRVIQDVEATWLARLRRPFEGLSEAERTQLVTLFHKLAQAIPAERDTIGSGEAVSGWPDGEQGGGRDEGERIGAGDGGGRGGG